MGQSSNVVYFMVSGAVLDETNGRIYKKGAMFGEQELLLKTDRDTTLRCLEDTFLFKFEKEIWEKIMIDNPPIH